MVESRALQVLPTTRTDVSAVWSAVTYTEITYNSRHESSNFANTFPAVCYAVVLCPHICNSALFSCIWGSLVLSHVLVPLSLHSHTS